MKADERRISDGSSSVCLPISRFTGGDRAILVSSDGYLGDVHHQWLASAVKGEPIKAIRLDAPIAQLLPQLREFPSATSAAGGIQAKRPTPPTARKPTGPTASAR